MAEEIGGSLPSKTQERRKKFLRESLHFTNIEALFIDSFSSWQKHQQKCKPFSSNTLLRPPHETLSSTCYGRTLQFHKVKQLNRFDLNCKWDAHCDASYSQRKRVHLKWELLAVSHILPINQKRGSQWNHDPESLDWSRFPCVFHVLTILIVLVPK